MPRLHTAGLWRPLRVLFGVLVLSVLPGAIPASVCRAAEAAAAADAPSRRDVIAARLKAIAADLDSVAKDDAAWRAAVREQSAAVADPARIPELQGEDVRALLARIRETEAALADLRRQLQEKIAASEAYRARAAGGDVLRAKAAASAETRQRLLTERAALLRELDALEREAAAKAAVERKAGE